MSTNRENVQLGDRVKDRITGFKGIVVAITEWLNGCTRIMVQPEKLEAGKVVDGLTFDVEQVEILKRAVVVTAPPAPLPKTGGGGRNDLAAQRR